MTKSYRRILTVIMASCVALPVSQAVAQQDAGAGRQRERDRSQETTQQRPPNRERGQRQDGEQLRQRDGGQNQVRREGRPEQGQREQGQREPSQREPSQRERGQADRRQTRSPAPERSVGRPDRNTPAQVGTQPEAPRNRPNGEASAPNRNNAGRTDRPDRADRRDARSNTPEERREVRPQATPEFKTGDKSRDASDRAPQGNPDRGNAQRPDDRRDASSRSNSIETMRPRDGDRNRRDDAASINELKKQRSVRKEDGGRREIISEPGDRKIIREGNRLIIRNDDGRRFGGGKRNVQRRDNHEIVTVLRPNGIEVISVYSRDGRLVERRRRRNGRETLLINNRRAFGTGLAIGLGVAGLVVVLSDPVVRIPRRRYIVDYENASRDDVYEALSAPPIEKLERRYALDEIRYSHSLRERLRRVDLNTVTFNSGTWEIENDQLRKLERLGNAISRVLKADPDEIFLIEGHTDAVGSDIDNLTLSDRRAESIAEFLTSEYGIPPENLITQGYGEKFLKVDTDGDEPANRRVAVRRITPLLDRS